MKKYILFLLCSIALLAGCSKKNGTGASGRPYDGIDVSHHQGKINWTAVAENPDIQFVYIKASEGTTLRDKAFMRNAMEARRNGIKIGAYHVLSMRTSPETQFQNFLRALGPARTEMDLIPAIDIEANWRTHPNLVSYTRRMCQLMQQRFGRKPLIYTTPRLYQERLHPEFASYYLWIASYRPECPQLHESTHVNIWQYTENGHISGYKKPIDLNRFVNGMTLDRLLLRP